MRVVIITQDDPFYLPEALRYLFEICAGRYEFVGCVLLNASPFGKKESIVQKALKTRRIFGNAFFIRYALRFIRNKLFEPNAVERVFRKNGISVTRLDESVNSPKSLALIRAMNPDILLSVAGNEIFKRPLIELAPKGCLNLHTALLPKYRGLMPSFWVLKNREQYTGTSVFLVDEGIDSGPIVVQKRIAIGPMSQEELIRFSKRVGMEAIAESLDAMEAPNPTLLPNDAGEATYFGFPTAEDVKAFQKADARFY